MKENWTKGPWEIRKYKDPYGRREVAVEIATDEIIIAKLGIEIDSECAANTHLIAASPEMYAALDSIVAVVGLTAFKYEGQRAVLQEAVDNAVAALKKARGEE